MVIEDALKENAGVGVYISVKQCKKCGAFLVKKGKYLVCERGHGEKQTHLKHNYNIDR